MYHLLGCVESGDDDGGTVEISDRITHVLDLADWTSGAALGLAQHTPFELPLRTIRGATAPPADFYCARICVMSSRMVDALRDAGVDNLQMYPANLADDRTNKKWPAFVVNIVGLVAAADLEASVRANAGDTTPGQIDFEDLVIDPNAAGGFSLFRLAENPELIVIHERVKASLERHAFAGVFVGDALTAKRSSSATAG